MPYDRTKAERVIKFVSGLKHVKGRQWAGRPFTLIPWQEHEVIRPFFGTLKENGTRRYRICYVEVPKKDGKSELASAVGNYALYADGEAGAEVYAAAGNLDQASIVFDSAAAMVRMNPRLLERSNVLDSRKRIVVPRTNSVFVALSKEHLSKHGLNPSCVVIDELHAHKTRELYDALIEGTDAAREQQIIFIITTAGVFDKNSIAWEVHDYAMKVKKGIIDDPTFLPVIYMAEDDDDWTDEAVWKKVNPSLGYIIDIENIREHYATVVNVPSRQNNFRRFRLNQWVGQTTRWLPMDYWDACNKGPVNIERLRGDKCYAGLDLASTEDITAFVLVFPPEDADRGDYIIVPYFWMPDENIQERGRKGRAPFEMWARNGLIELTPGPVTDYRFVLKVIDEAARMFDIQEIAFDRWGATKVVQDLQDMGFDPVYDTDKEPDPGRHLIQFGQGFGSMGRPTKALLHLVLAQRINHGGNPVLRWMADNVVVRMDPAGSVKPDKSRSLEKIDGITAMEMGLDRALANLEGEDLSKMYETEEIFAI